MEPSVLTGIDILQRDGYAPLRGKRIGLITNHTGLDREGHPTVDLLHTAPSVRLTTLFSPEHGLRGALDEKVSDGRDDRTGLPIFSLYGARTSPTAEQLADLEALVYDIQDIGVRFYTYISTLGHCMEAAAKQSLAFYVLDRPNPLGGVKLEGPIADVDKLSFTAFHPLPVRHGLTVGELAKLFQAEKKMHLDLHVIGMEGWRRNDLWDATGLTWTNPSPNMRSLTEALLYPGIGLLETTNLSVGRGTDTPFEVIGAPWLDGRKLAATLNERHLPGVRFVPIRFTPTSSVHAGKLCGGLNIIITSWDRFIPVLTGLAIAETLHRLYPKDWEIARYIRLLVHQQTLEQLQAGATAESLAASWQPSLRDYQKRRKPYLLYT